MRVVIAGAGFAGLTLAQRLPRAMEVTVLDPAPRFGFLPNIHELVSGVKRPADLELDRARLVGRAGHGFHRDALVAVDREGREARTREGRVLPYDHLVLAVGGVDQLHGVTGAKEHAYPFKTVSQGAAIGARLRALFAHADGPRRHVVIVGGGLEGVECLGEILRRYRRHPALQVDLVESRTRLLHGTPAALDRHLRARCDALPVRFHLGARVRAVTPEAVVLGSGESLPAAITIWTGGLQPPRWIRQGDLAGPGTGWVPTTAALRSAAHPHFWVAGDVAEVPTPLTKQAYYAMQMGAHVAEGLTRVARGRDPRPFRPRPKPMLISFGDLDTILVLDRRALAGPALAALKEGVFQLGMAQLQGAATATALPALGRRLGQAARALLLPQLGSLAALRRLPGVTVLSEGRSN